MSLKQFMMGRIPIEILGYFLKEAQKESQTELLEFKHGGIPAKVSEVINRKTPGGIFYRMSAGISGLIPGLTLRKLPGNTPKRIPEEIIRGLLGRTLRAIPREFPKVIPVRIWR